jgi:parvulin-like peptidyl-prolyl isomerase
MNRRLIAAFAGLLVALVPAESLPQRKIEQIVARVNNEVILKSDLDREMAVRASQMREEGLEGARLEQELELESKDVLRDLIDRSLLVQVAKEAGETADREVLLAMEELRVREKFKTMEELEREIAKQYGDVEEFKNDIRSKHLTQRVIEHEVYGRIVITNEEMRKYYEANKEKFDRPAGIRLSEIVVLYDQRLPDQAASQRKKIEEAYALLKKGDAFEDVARKLSEVSSAANGGDFGFFGQGDLNEEIEKTVGNLAKGEYTEILTGTDAYIIYKVTDKHNGGILPMELAQQFIWQEMMSKQAPPKVREYLTRLRRDGFVEVKEGFVDSGAPAK